MGASSYVHVQKCPGTLMLIGVMIWWGTPGDDGGPIR